MLLSSVNFVKTKNVANTGISSQQFSDFILGKIKEDQDKKERKSAVYTPLSSKQQKPKRTENVFIFPSTRPKTTADKKQTSPAENEENNFVSVETSDGYFVSIDPTAQGQKVFLEDNVFPSQHASTLKQILFKCEEEDKSKQCLAVFQFLMPGHDNAYLTVTKDRILDVVKYETMPNPLEPDERFFVLYYTGDGNVLLQPKAHKGYYIHHMDQELHVRRLEINWRPPEEYFFEIHVKDTCEEEVMKSIDSSKHLVQEPEKENQPKAAKSEHQKLSQQQKKLIENVKVQSSKPSLFLGCFGVRSKKIAHGAKYDKAKR